FAVIQDDSAIDRVLKKAMIPCARQQSTVSIREPMCRHCLDESVNRVFSSGIEFKSLCNERSPIGIRNNASSLRSILVPDGSGVGPYSAFELASMASSDVLG